MKRLFIEQPLALPGSAKYMAAPRSSPSAASITTKIKHVARFVRHCLFADPFPPNLQNKINPKWLELGTSNFDTMTPTPCLSHDTCDTCGEASRWRVFYQHGLGLVYYNIPPSYIVRST